ncbi:MAG TPA: DUF4129 domain-containing protein [Cellvibrionaceae bacterium]
MDLEHRAVEIRPRTPWEACDLGIQMGRHWWWPMMKIWLVLAAPWLLLSWVLPARYGPLSLLLYWLGKPLWERFLLHFLSQAIFGSTPSTHQVLSSARRLLADDWLASVLWRRFSPWRAYNCALAVLEGQTGKARSLRLRHLDSDNASVAAKVAVLIMHIEGFLVLSICLVTYALIPRELHGTATDIGQLMNNGAVIAAYNAVYILVSALVAPFFVATGFALYLNRRIWLEAWDIDISFKALAKRLGNTLVLLIFGLWLGFSSICAPAAAAAEQEEVPPQNSAQQDIGKALNTLADPMVLFTELSPPQILNARVPAEQLQIQAILAGDEFHQKHMQLKHQWRWPWHLPEQKPADRQFWEEVIAVAAQVLEALLWALALSLIFWLALNYRKLVNRFGEAKLRSTTAPTPLHAFGLDLRPASLPDDVVAVALMHCQAGEFRQGLALLYRATLVALLQQGLELKASFTEEDCLAQASNGALHLSPQALEYLRRLTSHWQNLAYGHQLPALALAEELCLGWRVLWQPGVTKRV